MKLKKVKKLHGRGARVQVLCKGVWATLRNPKFKAPSDYRIHPEDKGKFKSNWSTTDAVCQNSWHEILINGKYYFYKRSEKKYVLIGDFDVKNGLSNSRRCNDIEDSIDRIRILYQKEIETLYTKYPEAKPKEYPCICVGSNGIMPPKDYCATVKVTDTPMNTVVKDFCPKYFKVGEEVYVKAKVIDAGDTLSRLQFIGHYGWGEGGCKRFANKDILKSKTCV